MRGSLRGSPHEGKGTTLLLKRNNAPRNDTNAPVKRVCKYIMFRECIKHIPEDKLLVETDSPYLSPKKKIRRNEPKFLIDVVAEIALLRKETKESIINSSFENSLNFFNLHR